MKSFLIFAAFASQVMICSGCHLEEETSTDMPQSNTIQLAQLEVVADPDLALNSDELLEDTLGMKLQAPLEDLIQMDTEQEQQLDEQADDLLAATEKLFEQDTDQLYLKQFVIARDVENRNPVDTGTIFEVKKGERLYAYLHIQNPTRETTDLTVSWAPLDSGSERGEATLEVGAAKRWRTWAYTRAASKPGRWKAIVRNTDGDIIAEAPFMVIENQD